MVEKLATGNHTRRKGEDMMPLQFADAGSEQVIRRIGGTPEVKKHLENLGFVVGGTVRVVSSSGGNLIVSVKDSRIAVSREMAQKIMI
jgi:Fe2+ transport system protein A